MKIFGIALGLAGFCLVGSLTAHQECISGDVAKEAAVVDSFVATDSGESRAWLYAATEDEIKNLFAQAKKEGWNAEQFSAACTQLVAQQRAIGASLEDRHEWAAQELFMFGFAGGIVIAAVIAGFIYLMQGDVGGAAPVLNVQGVERELVRLRASVTQQGARTRAAINQLRNLDGAQAPHSSESSASSGSKHSHRPRR